MHLNDEKLPEPSAETVKNLKELVKYLQIGARFDLKTFALETLLGITGSDDGIISVLYLEQIPISLVGLLQDSSGIVSKHSAKTLINLSAEQSFGPRVLLNLNFANYSIPLQNNPRSIVEVCFKHIFNVKSSIADECCMILSNLSRNENNVKTIYDLLQDTEYTFDDIVRIFTKINYIETGAKLHYLGPFLSNMSQDERVRTFILNREACVIQQLLPFTEYEESTVRRGGIVGTLRNCCFELASNAWLLSEDVDILPRLLLPLAGNEEFDDEDNEKLPLELQYLPEDKMREPDPDIRKMLIESITQLCSEKKNREFIRDKNTYIILRELHKWEKDEAVLSACENLVDLLIRTESEIACENLKNIEVPEELTSKFEKLNAE